MFGVPAFTRRFFWFSTPIHSDKTSVDIRNEQRVNNQQRSLPSEPPVTDSMLIQRVAQGDDQALSELYNRYAATVLGIALKIVRQREIAEEVTQEAFWRVWQRAHTFDSTRGNVAPWLFGIARNLSIDEIRRRAVRPQAAYDTDDHSWIDDVADEQNVEDVVWVDEQRAAVRSALRQLSPEQREALELAYFSGLTQREIADKLGNPLGTVKTRVRLGLLKLRDLLNGQQWND